MSSPSALDISERLYKRTRRIAPHTARLLPSCPASAELLFQQGAHGTRHRLTTFCLMAIKRLTRIFTTAGGPTHGAPKMSGGRSSPRLCFSLSWLASFSTAASTCRSSPCPKVEGAEEHELKSNLAFYEGVRQGPSTRPPAARSSGLTYRRLPSANDKCLLNGFLNVGNKLLVA